MNVSLYCSPTHLKLLVGTPDRDGVKVEDFAVFPLPVGAMINGIITDEDAMVRFLAEAGAELGVLKHDAWLVIDNNSIRSKVMDMPSVSEAKMLEFVARDLGAFTDEAVSDIFDYAVLNPRLPDGGGTRILGVAVGRDILQTYRNTVSSAGFNLKNISIGVGAAIKLAHVSPQLNTGARILAVADDRNLTLTLFEAGDYKITNKYRLFAADDTPEWRQEIGGNISSVIQFHKGQRPTEELSAVLFAGLSASQVEALASALSFLGVEIDTLDLGARVRLAGKAAANEAAFNPGKYLFNIGTLLKR